MTRWDGQTLKKHPVTGEDVPDEAARTLVFRYTNPRKATWPKADFVVGNPPFIGEQDDEGCSWSTATLRLFAARTDIPSPPTLRAVSGGTELPELTRKGALRRFGFVSTNSIRQKFERRVIQHTSEAAEPISLLYAIPDHPWVDDSGLGLTFG